MPVEQVVKAYDIYCKQFTEFILKIKDYAVDIDYLVEYLLICSIDWENIDLSEFGTIFHKHHVLPKSIFPEYAKNKNNIIKIPVKMHEYVHYILHKALPGNGPMASAAAFLSNNFGFSFNEEEYLKLRLLLNKIQSNKMLGDKNAVHKAIKNGNHNVQKQLKKWYTPRIAKKQLFSACFFYWYSSNDS